MTLPEGLYDCLITEALRARLEEATTAGAKVEQRELLGAEAAERLAQEVMRQLSSLLDELRTDGKRETLLQQLAVTNDVLVWLRRYLKDNNPTLGEDVDAVILPIHERVLTAVHRSPNPPQSPVTGLSVPWLFTAGKDSPSLLNELRLEMAAADRVDILVSFITNAGIRKIRDILDLATATDAHGKPRTQVRVLTTTYTGATDQEALNVLASLPGCEVRVSLDGSRTRLHAKAWLFHRNTGYGSAYVGSANLSGAALLGGLEWTVKFTEHRDAEMFERAKAHFETLWNDREFSRYDPANEHHRDELRRALKRERREDENGAGLILTFFDVEPKPFQQDMLNQLALERQHGRMRNLVVAATGTGKTMVAAFDYRRVASEVGGYPRLLFVAHRREILKQARDTWRNVLRHNDFGEILADGAEPESFDHLFATIDSVASRGLLKQCGAEYWHYVIIDECHRITGQRFDELATTIKPRILLGLTATPERADGNPILRYFENRPDGSPAVELRLWHALDQQLLCAFEYFGCDDETDLSDVPWDQAGERSALDSALTGNEMRARLVVSEWERLTGNARGSRALAFCVSVDHAKYMTDYFNRAGLPAMLVVGETDTNERREAPKRLSDGAVCVLVTCDLYNEGVDLPSVDTLLLLRPTQSPVLFQQQLGRGLRRFEGKESCLVIDFVGRFRETFRFDRLLSSITGLTRRDLIEGVEKGFSGLPPGCHIQLQKQTREQVLRNLRSAVNLRWHGMVAELRNFAAQGRANARLGEFLHEQALELDDLYREQRANNGWTALRRQADLVRTHEGPEEAYFGRRFAGLLHVDDPEHIEFIRRVATKRMDWNDLSPMDQRRLHMLACQIDGDANRATTATEFLARLDESPEMRDELDQLAEVLGIRTTLIHNPVAGLEHSPLCLHAAYQRREILAAVGFMKSDHRPQMREGVLALKDAKQELLFVTLDKREGFHDRISYHDYAVAPEVFHWQTQNSAGPDTKAGRRYLESPGNGWSFQLFIRRDSDDAFRVCGPVTLEKAEGNRPMSITWKLTEQMPWSFFMDCRVIREA